MSQLQSIRDTLRRYAIRTHYLATSASKRTLYAVFSEGVALTEPMSHTEAREKMEELIAYDLLEQFAAPASDKLIVNGLLDPVGELRA